MSEPKIQKYAIKSETFVTFGTLPSKLSSAFTFPEAADPTPKNFSPGFSGTGDHHDGDADALDGDGELVGDDAGEVLCDF